MGVGVFRALALACAMALGGMAAAADPDQAVPTAADFGALPVILQPVISPDGKMIAARGIARGTRVVFLFDTDKEHRSVTPIPVPDKYRIEWVRWAGSRRLLVSLSAKTVLFDEEYRMARVAVVDLDGGKQRFLDLRDGMGVDGDNVIHIDKAGNFVLLSTQPSIYDWPAVYRIDLATGKATKIVNARDNVWDWYADNDGVVRAGLATLDGKWWVYYRSKADADFQRTQRREMAGRDDTRIDRFMVVGNSNIGFAVAAGKTGRFGLYRYDFATDALGERIFENPSVDIDDFDLAADGSVRAVFFDDDKPEVAWFDPEMQRLQARLDKALPGHLNRVISASDDKMQMIVWSSSADDPGTFFTYNRKTGHMDGFADSYSTLSGKRLAPMEPVRYKARDGLELRAYLTMPPGRGDKNLPMVVMPHGGPFVRDSWGYDPWAQYLASKGYVVLQPNFRGSTGFGRDFVAKGMGQWGRGMQDDIDDGVKWLAGRGTVDPKRVCIMGASFGGYAAMWAAVRNPEIYRCAISFAGISDVASMLRYDRRSMSATRYFRDWRSRVQGDKDFALDTVSPLKQVERMTVPILLAHGEEDDNVPLYQSRRLHEALLKLKRPHEYVVYPKEGHGFSDPVHSTDFLERVGKFLDQHNPAGS
jgi:dipeptidyl aminopeptidase/acylaminoacyl peptidase